MLQSIRDHTQGWIAGVIISMLILSFALWGIHSYIGGNADNSVVAKVNGEEISRGQLTVAYERLRRQMQTQFNSSYQMPEQAEAGLKDRALQALINIQVLKQASQSQNYRISSDQIDSFLESLPDFQVDGVFSQARFQQVLETTMFNAADFLELIKTSLLIDQPRLGLIFTSFALPNEIVDNIALVNQERDIQYVTIPLQSVAKQPVQISDDKIQAYYKQHQDEFKTPEQVSIEYVELSLKDLMANIQPTDAMLKSFYNENSGSFIQPMQWKLESIVIPLSETASNEEVNKTETQVRDLIQQASGGKSLSSLAKEFGALKSDAKFENWVTINQVPAELQKSVIALTKVGQVATPVRNSNGIVIVKATAIKEAVVQPFDQVKAKIKDAYIRQKAEEKFADMREKLANLAFEHQDSLDAPVKTLGLTLKTTELFSKEKGGKDIAANNKVREAAFSNDVLNLQYNSDVIQVSGDDAIVLRVKTHAPATLLTLNTVQKQIVDKLKAAEIDSMGARLADELKQKLLNGMTPDQVAQQYRLSWKQVGFIGRHSNKIDTAILDTAFAMPRPQSGKSLSYAYAKIPNGYAVIALKSVRDGALASDHHQYQVFAEQIQNTQGLMEYELYKQSLMREAKISTDS